MREKNIILSPSLLACDFARAGEQLAALERAGIRQIHLDVMDGIFVPNISFGQVVIRSLRKSTSLFFDTHLMITEPERYIEDFAAAGSDRITVHLESCADVGPALDRIAGQTPPRIRCRRPWGNLRGDALWRMLEKRLVEKNAHQGEFFVSSQR